MEVSTALATMKRLAFPKHCGHHKPRWLASLLREKTQSKSKINGEKKIISLTDKSET